MSLIKFYTATFHSRTSGMIDIVDVIIAVASHKQFSVVFVSVRVFPT